MEKTPFSVSAKQRLAEIQAKKMKFPGGDSRQNGYRTSYAMSLCVELTGIILLATNSRKVKAFLPLLLTVAVLLPVYGADPAKKPTTTGKQSQPSTNTVPINVTVNPFPVTIANPSTNITTTIVPPSKDQPIYLHVDYKQPADPSSLTLAIISTIVVLLAALASAIISSTILNRNQELDFKRKKLEGLYVSHTKAAKQITRKLLYLIRTLENPQEYGKIAIEEMERMMFADFGADAEAEMLSNLYYPHLVKAAEKIIKVHNDSVKTIDDALKAYNADKDTKEFRDALHEDMEIVEALEEEFNALLIAESRKLKFVPTWNLWEQFTRP